MAFKKPAKPEAPAKKAAPPAKKAAVPEKPAKKPGKEIANWSEELARQAQMATKIEESVGGGGQYFSTKSGVLAFQGNELPDNEMDVIVLDHVIENSLYEGRFDPENPSSPVCFAFGTDADEMAPHEQSSDPKSDGCAGCPFNEWESADEGKGKACKNIRRLALLPFDAIEDGISEAEAAFIKVPVTSVKNWAAYVRKVASTLNRPPLGVVTRIKLVKDSKTQFKMTFTLVEEIDGEHIGDLLEKQKEVQETLVAPYAKPSEDDRPARGKGRAGGGRNKPAARKKLR